MYIVDSNILLDFPQIVENKKDLIIPIIVLKELDGLKKHVNPDIASNARRAAVYISRNIDNLEFYTEEEGGSVDDQLLEITEILEGILLTNDVYLKIRAISKGIRTEGYTSKDNYTGVYYYSIDVDDNLYNKELDDFLSTGRPPKGIELFKNEYFVVKNKDEVMSTFVYDGEKLDVIKPRVIKNQYIDKIYPRNTEQECLFDILFNKDVSIVYAGGVYGSGKSFIVNNYALQELEKGNIKKIVYVPNNAYTENALEVGTLPGSLENKIVGQIGPLIDLVGIDRINDMITKEELEIVPMSFIRGRSFEDSIVIINESQNLTEDHIKLLIARCGEGTRIFFDGDIKQADSQLFRNKNGLKLLLNLRNSEEFAPIFATVKLVKTERSKTARASDFLDSI